MSDFALGVNWEILLRLPAESLFRFRAVCKRWRATIDDPSFVKAHTNNQLSSNRTTIVVRNSAGPPFSPFFYFDLEALDFVTIGLQTISVTPLEFTRTGLSRLPKFPVSACNGLLLTAPKYHRNEANDWEYEGTWEIWNPLSQERLKLPQPNINSFVVGIGLGYDCAADDYKVVLIDYNRRTHVYSLKLGLWKNIGNCPFDKQSFSVERGVFHNGSLLWVFDGDGDDDGIVVLDVVTENYRKLALPSFETRPDSRLQLDALSGCLFLSYDIYGQQRCLDAWVMNENQGKDLWMKLFSSYECCGCRPVAYMKNRNWVLLQCSSGFTWFDVESNSTTAISIHGIHEDLSAQVCIGNLFRLHDSCGRRRVAGKTRKRKMADTKLTFCIRAYRSRPHDACYLLDSNWHHSLKKRDKQLSDGDSATLSVPLDICREIFLRLPEKSLIRFRAVCNTWRAVIDDPVFVKAHTNKQLSSNTIVIRNSTGPPFSPLYSCNLDDLNLADGLQAISVTPLDFTQSGLSLLPALPVAACNGLIVVSREIWNPLTHERLKLPPGNCGYSNCKEEAIGLGYDEACDDYKVVAIHRHRLHCGKEDEENVFRTYIYSLRSDLWRNIGNFPHVKDEWWQVQGPKGPGVFLCGALHWPFFNSPNGTDTIIALDLGREKYRHVQAPPLRDRRVGLNIKKRNLEVLGGCLVVSDYSQSISIEGEKQLIDVWVMKDYGEGDSWIKLFSSEEEELKSFNLYDELRPVAYMTNKTQILLQHDWRGFFLFDVESNSMKKVGIHGLSGISAQIIPGSIFRLHDNCGVSGRSRTKESKREMKMHNDTKLYFCARDGGWHPGGRHDDCYSQDSNWDYLSSEDEC